MARSIRKLKKQTKLKQKYLRYYRGGGRMTWAQWLRKQSSTSRTKNVTGQLKQAGLSQQDIDKLQMGKRYK